MTARFWRDDPDAEWATLLSMVDTYCHPEAWEDAYDHLKELARESDDEQVIRFKQELRAAIQDPGRLPKGALSRAAVYDDGSDLKFLVRLWRDLYPDEALPS